ALSRISASRSCSAAGTRPASGSCPSRRIVVSASDGTAGAYRDSSPASPGDEAMSGARLNRLEHDPAVLADLAVAGESELLVRRERAVEEEAGRHRPGSLRIALDRPAAEARDEVECALDRGGGHAPAAQPFADEAAADPPVRQCREPFLVRGAVLDP